MPETPELVHPLARRPDAEQWSTGPAIGDPLPDFTLPDQHGRPVAFHEVRGGDRALLAFQRSSVG